MAYTLEEEEEHLERFISDVKRIAALGSLRSDGLEELFIKSRPALMQSELRRALNERASMLEFTSGSVLTLSGMCAPKEGLNNISLRVILSAAAAPLNLRVDALESLAAPTVEPAELWQFIQKNGIPTGGNYSPKLGESSGCWPYDYRPCDHAPTNPSLLGYTPWKTLHCRLCAFSDLHFVDEVISLPKDINAIKEAIYKGGPGGPRSVSHRRENDVWDP
ncbi:hypothetical protein FOL47_007281 [Perkinsus chesapeaki]|uniref:Uncharacterized protein n=1 Tax=Perkinsus chesapeaki TaxID=330153 RepID=A0A7J6LMK6_PERCH|nr:hypothetical protein FOL47_007281 [Perkinsus chesapeaki]